MGFSITISVGDSYKPASAVTTVAGSGVVLQLPGAVTVVPVFLSLPAVVTVRTWIMSSVGDVVLTIAAKCSVPLGSGTKAVVVLPVPTLKGTAEPMGVPNTTGAVAPVSTTASKLDSPEGSVSTTDSKVKPVVVGLKYVRSTKVDIPGAPAVSIVVTTVSDVADGIDNRCRVVLLPPGKQTTKSTVDNTVVAKGSAGSNTLMVTSPKATDASVVLMPCGIAGGPFQVINVSRNVVVKIGTTAWNNVVGVNGWNVEVVIIGTVAVVNAAAVVKNASGNVLRAGLRISSSTKGIDSSLWTFVILAWLHRVSHS